MKKAFLFIEMTYLSYKESHPSVTLSLNRLNSENVDVSVKHGYYQPIYPHQPVSKNVQFQIHSSKDYFIDLTSTFIDLHVIFKNLTMKNQVQLRGYPMKILY